MKSLLLLLFFIAVSSAQNCLSSADRLINKRCFTFVNQQLSYQDARDWCHFRNPVTFSYLATVPDANTANFLASIAHTLFNNNGGYFWIGLSRYNNKFQWDDGTPVSWTNFQLQNSQNYVAESITNAKWTTYPNDNKYNFICSYDPNGSQTGRPTYPPDTSVAPWGTTAETETPPGPTPTGKPR
ncbi:CBN-CLEC-80 protein [Caenorhabditis brenneri]|uniref:CBN-CLEC-80 protein n=1 Tax=Caenorhabditis brenneri TaxID=135651 RepID=G0N6H5_CAEBE|nr:CBN-CLEC-80 protein [Caenorhabditis brenneri]